MPRQRKEVIAETSDIPDEATQQELAGEVAEFTKEKIEIPQFKSEDYTYTMPYGYEDSNGNLHNTFTIRPMRGDDERAFNAPDVRENGGKLLRTLAERLTTSIGDLRKEDMSRSEWRDIIKKLYIYDMDYIVAVAQTYNSENGFAIEGTCPECGFDEEHTYTVEDLEIVPFKSKFAEIEFSEGIQRNGKYYTSGTLRIPTAADREVLGAVTKKSAEADSFDTYVSRLLTVEGVDFITATDIHNMLSKDRKKIRTALRDELGFGPDNKIKVTCSECGEEYEVEISVGNFM